MIKLESIADVAKAFSGIGSHFKKMAEHHNLAHGHHAAHAAFAKAHADGLADDHEHKAYFHKAHEHHTAMAAVHKAMADHHEAMHSEHAASEKVAKVDPTPPPVVEITKGAETEDGKDKKVGEKTADDAITKMIDQTVQSVTEKALETVAKSGKIEEMIEQIVLKRMNERLGNITVPDGAHGALPTVPAHLVPRPGQLEGMEKSASEMPAELAHWGN